MIQGIHARSPKARVFVMNYPAIFPETGYGCFPQMPIGFGDVPYLRSTEQHLDQMIAEQAAANGATLVNWYAASIGHDSCKSLSNRWVEPLIPSELAFPIHPNKAGMAGGAATLEAAIGMSRRVVHAFEAERTSALAAVGGEELAAAAGAELGVAGRVADQLRGAPARACGWRSRA